MRVHRATSDTVVLAKFAAYLLRVGENREPLVTGFRDPCMIRLPPALCFDVGDVGKMDSVDYAATACLPLVDWVFPQLNQLAEREIIKMRHFAFATTLRTMSYVGLPDANVPPSPLVYAATQRLAFACRLLDVDYGQWLSQRAILAPLNTIVNAINDAILARYPGEERTSPPSRVGYGLSGAMCCVRRLFVEFGSYLHLVLLSYSYIIMYLSTMGGVVVCTSADRCADDCGAAFQLPIEFLNSLECSGLPAHRLALKPNVPIMLMRNLKPSIGLCNGTRLLYRGMDSSNRLLHATIISGGSAHNGRDVLIPRIKLSPDETSFGFNWSRRQFPVKLAFAMSVNKSQGVFYTSPTRYACATCDSVHATSLV